MAPTLSQAFGIALREARIAHKLSQDELALSAGIDRAYFGHIERATKSPTLKTVEKLTAALQTRPSKLFRRAEQIIDQYTGSAKR
jgi:transcriptional regulator with XRE-family HTH domain